MKNITSEIFNLKNENEKLLIEFSKWKQEIINALLLKIYSKNNNVNIVLSWREYKYPWDLSWGWFITLKWLDSEYIKYIETIYDDYLVLVLAAIENEKHIIQLKIDNIEEYVLEKQEMNKEFNKMFKEFNISRSKKKERDKEDILSELKILLDIMNWENKDYSILSNTSEFELLKFSKYFDFLNINWLLTGDKQLFKSMFFSNYLSKSNIAKYIGWQNIVEDKNDIDINDFSLFQMNINVLNKSNDWINIILGIVEIESIKRNLCILENINKLEDDDNKEAIESIKEEYLWKIEHSKKIIEKSDNDNYWVDNDDETFYNTYYIIDEPDSKKEFHILLDITKDYLGKKFPSIKNEIKYTFELELSILEEWKR